MFGHVVKNSSVVRIGHRLIYSVYSYAVELPLNTHFHAGELMSYGRRWGSQASTVQVVCRRGTADELVQIDNRSRTMPRMPCLLRRRLECSKVRQYRPSRAK
jgi:hypothetical protein